MYLHASCRQFDRIKTMVNRVLLGIACVELQSCFAPCSFDAIQWLELSWIIRHILYIKAIVLLSGLFQLEWYTWKIKNSFLIHIRLIRLFTFFCTCQAPSSWMRIIKFKRINKFGTCINYSYNSQKVISTRSPYRRPRKGLYNSINHHRID